MGWEVSSGKKALDFAECFTALGVSFRLRPLCCARSTVTNKDGLVEEYLCLLEAMSAKGFLNTDDVAIIRGKSKYLEFQTFGRAGKGMRSNFLHPGPLSEATKRLMCAFSEWLVNAPPRVISPALGTCKVLFTDGAC
eukprot:3293287-Amphidinium_carterae.1